MIMHTSNDRFKHRRMKIFVNRVANNKLNGSVINHLVLVLDQSKMKMEAKK